MSHWMQRLVRHVSSMKRGPAAQLELTLRCVVFTRKDQRGTTSVTVPKIFCRPLLRFERGDTQWRLRNLPQSQHRRRQHRRRQHRKKPPRPRRPRLLKRLLHQKKLRLRRRRLHRKKLRLRRRRLRPKRLRLRRRLPLLKRLLRRSLQPRRPLPRRPDPIQALVP
ncbi:MAG: hypothetical protein RLZZ253_59 [Verrucomicrobiota bacterium]